MINRIVILSVMTIATTHAASPSLGMNDVLTFAKGALAGAVCIESAKKTVSEISQLHANRSVRSNIYHALLGASMGYSISKLAPYSRKSLLLENAQLLPKQETQSEKRYLSLIKTAIVGAGVVASANEIVHIFNDGNAKRKLGNLLNLAYASYNGSAYCFNKVQAVLK